MEQPTYAICVRKDDLDNPVEGSTVDVCAACETEVWIGKAARVFVAEEGAKILCALCGLLQMEQDIARDGEVEIVTNDLQRLGIAHELLRAHLN